ncbi:hypothetical protein GP486_008339 [Trichoglossum hirsutum]|uniref:Methyltransferase type 11 domain-containing protein n=1 Tax=Trichoglossum hirsutum TaxID=265104 RepID=A0A9P8L473_9PEZI|nr:hypothetical protein GP486_008339 [Trichoglossum hirsutum]
MELPEASLHLPIPEAYEAEHVHHVYEQIAGHFSSTRYKPWPMVESFLKMQPDGSVGLDVGCGNGKYLTVNPKIFILGSDRSPALTKIASQHDHHSVVVADALLLPHPHSRFDFAISVAVIHHLSTASRRVMAIKTILDALKPSGNTSGMHGCLEKETKPGSGGRALIYVWALEQRGSRRGWDEGCEQDVMVPWVTKGEPNSAIHGTGNKSRKETGLKRRGKRYAPKDASQRTGREDSRSESEDMKSTVPPSTDRTEQEPSTEAIREFGTPKGGPSPDGREKSAEVTKTFQRYYHLYRSGELERDVVMAGGRVVDSGYERDNWWVIATRVIE